MSITLFAAVKAINDATLLMQILPPLVEQAKALGKGDDHVFTDEELDSHAASVGANVGDLRKLIEAMP